MYILSPETKSSDIGTDYYYEKDLNGNVRIIKILNANIIPFIGSRVKFGPKFYGEIYNIVYDYEDEGIIVVQTKVW
jgi:hypothetical protein